ncbi:MAG: hypothetical protein [Circular genetic element sp.]|nr:MAG: hypothetical protein [Circular genetic element sp.]
MENNLAYALKSTTAYLNVARDLSRVNSKNEEITSRDGHVFGYLVDVKVTGSSISAFRAPNTWKMRNSFRKFHAYRDLMFDNAGIEGEEKGRYGKTIRPYLDAGHVNGTEAQVLSVDSAGGEVDFDGGEWTYTSLATTPIYGEGPRPGTSTQQWADAFSLHICEENVIELAGDETQSDMYSQVGMIHSYNLDRMEVVTPTALETVSGPSNPLAQLRLTGNQAGGAVLDIAEDQELEAPPYDLLDNGDSIQTINGGFGASTSEFPTIRFQTFVPAGLMRVVTTATSVSPVICEVTVLGKMLCKDMA